MNITPMQAQVLAVLRSLPDHEASFDCPPPELTPLTKWNWTICTLAEIGRVVIDRSSGGIAVRFYLSEAQKEVDRLIAPAFDFLPQLFEPPPIAEDDL